jgi:hypothetical protein
MTDAKLLDLVRQLMDSSPSSEKSRQELAKVLLKWFSGQVVKPIKLANLKAMHQAGGYDAFAALLGLSADADRIAVLSKVDPHRPEMQLRPKDKAMAHIASLASGAIAPAEAPKPVSGAKPRKPAKAKAGTSATGILASTPYSKPRSRRA